MKKLLRIGGYTRVSHDEQKKFGYSVAAQIEKISKWCENEGYQLVEMFVDEGFTAGNMKRPKLQEMLSRLNEFDVIVFTRLDRFSRNVLEANKMLELLQKNNVALKSIEEDDIDTSTADGMFMFQLKVSLAERELKKGSERIKSVFEYKVKEGQVITGSVPLGYKIGIEEGKKKILIDEKYVDLVSDLFYNFAQYHSIRGTMDYINKKYGINRGYMAFNRILKNPLYTGIYKGNEDYCTPYITFKQFARNQELIKKNIRQRKSNHVYLFTGLIKCPKCKGSMISQATLNKRYNRMYYTYRCARTYVQRRCDMKNSISEGLVLEPYIVENVEKLIKKHIMKVTEMKKAQKEAPEKRIKEIRNELDNLNYIFMKKRIEAKEYDKLYEALEIELKELEAAIPKDDTSHLQDFLDSNWKDIYNQLNRTNKRALWSNIIQEIVIDEDFKIVDIIFLK